MAQSDPSSSITELFPILLMPAVAALSVSAVQTYLGIGIHILPIAMVMALTLIIYALNGLSDRVEDGHNNPDRAAAASRYSIPILAIASSALCSSAFLLARQGRLYPSYGIILLAGVLYSFRFVPWLVRGRVFTRVRLKDVLLVKNVTIGVTWTSAVFLVPLRDALALRGTSLPQRLPFWFLVTGYALAVTTSSIFCDVEDRIGDAAAGVNTLPVRLGNERCIRLIWIASAVWTGLVGVSYLGLGSIGRSLNLGHFAFLTGMGLGYPLMVTLVLRATHVRRTTRRYVIEACDPLFACGLLLLSV